MSGVGGGLYDRYPDPEPDRHLVVPQPRIQAAQREWLFWFSMLVGLWAAFQGMVVPTLLFLLLIVTVPAVLFLQHQVKMQIREFGWKGLWR